MFKTRKLAYQKIVSTGSFMKKIQALSLEHKVDKPNVLNIRPAILILNRNTDKYEFRNQNQAANWVNVQKGSILC